MKVGDLVKNNKPYSPDRNGLVVNVISLYGKFNKKVIVLWEDGSKRPCWDYDLKVISEGR